MLNVVTMLTHNDPGPASLHGGQDFWKRRGVEYLQKFFAGADRHIKEDFIPYVITNVPELIGNEAIPLLTRKPLLPGWWAKLEMFRPEHDLKGRTIFFDLDNIIGGDLSPLLALETEGVLWALDDLINPRRFNSSTMYCRPEAYHGLWQHFIYDFAGHIQKYTVWPHASDQAFIWDYLRDNGMPFRFLQDVLPEGYILNSRTQLEQGADWSKTALVYGSWEPKPHNSSHPFYKEHWRL
jgi:hypothetical protein